jgi:hypothetical protein
LGDGSQPDDLQPEERRGLTGANSDLADANLERRFPVALGLYAVLALLVWFTMGEGKVLVHGRLVELRLVPLIVIGGLALRTVLARHAERIRRRSGNGSGSSSS